MELVVLELSEVLSHASLLVLKRQLALAFHQVIVELSNVLLVAMLIGPDELTKSLHGQSFLIQCPLVDKVLVAL